MMLIYLGYKIMAENTVIECTSPSELKTGEHSIDFFCEHLGPMPRPVESLDGLTYVDCKAKEDLQDSYFGKISETLSCIKKTRPYSRVKGALVITTARLTPTTRKRIALNSEVVCWDLTRLGLYGTLATVQLLGQRRKHSVRTKVYPESHMTVVLREPPPITLPHKTFEGDLFYDSEERLNRDGLRNALIAIRSTATWWSTIFARIHSLNGYTSDVAKVLTEELKQYSSWR
jgi:hypothetical protein